MDKEKILNRLKERVGTLFKVSDCYDKVINTLIFNDVSKDRMLDILSKMHEFLDSTMSEDIINIYLSSDLKKIYVAYLYDDCEYNDDISCRACIEVMEYDI